MVVVEKAGEFLGRLVKMKDGLEGLQYGFQKFFGEAKDYVDFKFSSELGDKLVTASRCPIHTTCRYGVKSTACPLQRVLREFTVWRT